MTMMLDILLTNAQEVLRAVETYQVQLGTLARLLDGAARSNGHDGEVLRTALSTIREKRKEMFP